MLTESSPLLVSEQQQKQQGQAPWLLHSEHKESSVTSALSWLWPWGTRDARTDDSIERALLAQGGVTVVGPSTEQGLESDIDSDAVFAEALDVEIDTQGNYIHTIAIRGGGGRGNTTASGKERGARRSLVLTHGYFAGVGFFFRNYRGLSQAEGWDVYAVDWLGMGRSSRPTYKGVRDSGPERRAEYAEEFFVESLEAWRQRMQIDKMVLCGHSFGGYMVGAYALKYPQHVEKLVLLSPIGVPEAPADLERRIWQGFEPVHRKQHAKEGEYRMASNTEAPVYDGKPSWQRLLLFRASLYMWDRNYSPQWVVRMCGPLGRRLVSWYIGRFSLLTDEQRRGMAAYAHQHAQLAESSAAALGDFLRPGGFARRPLVDRVPAVAMPTVFFYGSHDWVGQAGGEEIVRRIGGRVATRIYVVPNATHNFHIDNPEVFNRYMIEEMSNI
ncbi:hypothetical protein IWW39_003697 [Coemansia spiralis]|uniref:AB hydrolase-1 domain-containing protein n=1 Tax=Coemansia spiralis TaxID=417178 RepID=A0A9W8L419_9FUNG|nr:hypothetical protein IWW39_003697 [Coemansia spiralis]